MRKVNSFFLGLIICGILALLPSCVNTEDTKNGARQTTEENLVGDEPLTSVSVTEINKALINLNTIDQLQTFYNKEGIPFRVLITSEMINGINRMHISILDNSNDYIMSVVPYESAPCIYYESFVNMEYFDVNADGEEDIVITARYMSGVGSDGAIPQAYRITYLQSEGKYFADKNIVPVSEERHGDG